MNATKRPWMISDQSSPYMEGVIIAVGETEVAGVWNKADAEFIIRAVNTFDQAREALKMVKDWLGGEYYADQDLPEICEKIRNVLAAMEAQL